MDGGAEHTGADNFHFRKKAPSAFSQTHMWNSNCNFPTELSWFRGKFGKEKFGDSFTPLSFRASSGPTGVKNISIFSSDWNLLDKVWNIFSNKKMCAWLIKVVMPSYFCAMFLSVSLNNSNPDFRIGTLLRKQVLNPHLLGVSFNVT